MGDVPLLYAGDHGTRPQKGSKSMRCALLLEDHNAFRESLALLLSHEANIEMVAQASSVEEARAIVLEELDHIDVVVTELVLVNGSAQEFLKSLRQADGDASVLVLTVIRDRDSHEMALKLGAAEVMTKDASLEQIVATIKKLGSD
jgi:two-component system, NarL family, response regulator DevR